MTRNGSNCSSIHLLPVTAAGVAGALCAAFYLQWKKSNRDDDDEHQDGGSFLPFGHHRPSRADGDAIVQYNNNEWTTLLSTITSQSREFMSVQDNDDNNHNNHNNKNNKDCIYLDYNGTTPIYPDVLSQMLPYWIQHYGNPSSNHAYGKIPKFAIEKARKQILYNCLGADKNIPLSAIWFTACGTESNNTAIQLAYQCHRYKFQNTKKKPHIVTSNVEHPAIEQCLKALQDDELIDVTYVPVGTNGCIIAQDMITAIEQNKDNIILVTLMLANNESGALQPVKEISQYCHTHNILFHTDAAQACGKITVQLQDIGNPDMITLVGHKIGAPKGIACLYVRPNCYVEHGRQLFTKNRGILLQGGGQEFGIRGGTENVAYIVGFGYACLKAQQNLIRNAKHMENMRQRLLDQLKQQLQPVGIIVKPNGPIDSKLRLPNTLSVGLENIHSGQLLNEIGDVVAASAGAACHSSGSGSGVSTILQAMKVPETFARGTLRLSVGPTTSAKQIDQAVQIIAKAALEQHQNDTI